MPKPTRRAGRRPPEGRVRSGAVPERAELLKTLQAQGVPMDFRALAAALRVKGAPARHATQRRLEAMVRDGQLIRNRAEQYCLPEKVHLIVGEVIGHPDGYGFLTPDDGSPDIFLAARQMREVIHGDRVAVRIKGYDRRGRPEGSIAEVLERRTETVVGRYVHEAGVGFVVPDNPRITHQILVTPKARAETRPGQLVLVELTRQPGPHSQPIGRIERVLGDLDTPGIETEIAISAHVLPHVWPRAVSAELEHVPERVPTADKKDRVDLRRVPLVTIDGEDARDFDDAVYAEKSGSGWRLLVAIADVSHYVRPGTALDEEAADRGTSVYFPNRVVPMLPEELSNGLCSLNPAVDRLCMVCEMQVGAGGKVSRSQFYPAVMHSAARFTYTEVARILAGEVAPRRKKQAPVLDSLRYLYDVYKALLKSRGRRGALDFEIPEVRIEFDAGGRIADVHPRPRNDAHRLIEECMIAANVEAAKFLRRHRMPTLYRVHARPDFERLEIVREFLSSVGLSLGGGEQVRPADLRRVLERAKGRPDDELIETVLLRSMAQAEYAPENIGHFGLALEAYAHFTSPIRRYPDLLVHRGIRHLLEAGGKRGFGYGMGDMQELGLACSRRERRADEATREALLWLKIEFMQDKLGEEFDGIISGVTDFGVFVTLNGLQIDGLIHVTSLGSDYYTHDRSRHSLIGQRSGQEFRLTDPIRVRVVRASLEDRKIDFAPATEPGSSVLQRRRRRGRARR